MMEMRWGEQKWERGGDGTMIIGMGQNYGDGVKMGTNTLPCYSPVDTHPSTTGYTLPSIFTKISLQDYENK